VVLRNWFRWMLSASTIPRSASGYMASS
jgi:hypothetical protein